MKQQLLSPRQLADAIGVSESSLKRWADEGRIRATRTEGGHRRIPLAEALRYVRDNRVEVLRPDILGLPAVRGGVGEGDLAEQLYHLLREGRFEPARALFVGAWLDGESVASLCDGPMREALSRLGELWKHDDQGIFHEHRATEHCIQLLHSLRALLPTPDAPLVAVGGALESDPYILPSLMAATTLASEGLVAVNLGPECPPRILVQAAMAHDATMAWLSISSYRGKQATLERVDDVAGELDAIGVRLVVGGKALEALRSDSTPGDWLPGRSMAELAGIAKALRAGQSPASH